MPPRAASSAVKELAPKPAPPPSVRPHMLVGTLNSSDIADGLLADSVTLADSRNRHVAFGSLHCLSCGRKAVRNESRQASWQNDQHAWLPRRRWVPQGRGEHFFPHKRAARGGQCPLFCSFHVPLYPGLYRPTIMCT